MAAVVMIMVLNDRHLLRLLRDYVTYRVENGDHFRQDWLGIASLGPGTVEDGGFSMLLKRRFHTDYDRVLLIIHASNGPLGECAGRDARTRAHTLTASIMEHMCLPGFANAAAAIAIFELKVRLLADNGDEGTPLQVQAIKADLGRLIDLVCDHHKATNDQRALLAKVATIRNKLLHLELSRATGRIRPLADQLREGNVWMADLENAKVYQVSKTSTEQGRIYGWLLESQSSGAFAAIAEAVREAIGVIDVLRDRAYGDPEDEVK